MNYTNIIAIDPDVDKSGVALLEVATREMQLLSMECGELLQTLFKKITENTGTLAIVIEAGYLNKSNWHLSYRDTPRIAAAKGRAQGRNERTAEILVDYAKFIADNADNNVDVFAKRPLRKMWRGKDRKITHEELSQFVPLEKKRTNQEERDAALLAWEFAGLPIRVKV